MCGKDSHNKLLGDREKYREGNVKGNKRKRERESVLLNEQQVVQGGV